MTPTRTLPGYRVIQTLRGDTLQRIADRELGDAALWPDLIDLNNLRAPYITNDAALAVNGVLLAGDSLRIPSNALAEVQDETNDDLFGVDIKLTRKKLVAVDGNLSLTGGVDNLGQALRHLVVTEPGELLIHPRYGCGTRPFLGASNSLSNAVVAGSLVKRAVQADPRINRVQEATVAVEGDVLRINIRAEAIHAVPINVEAIA